MTNDKHDCPLCSKGVKFTMPKVLVSVKTLNGKRVESPTYLSLPKSVVAKIKSLSEKNGVPK